MQASIVDLRYHTKDILNAIGRCEEVEILYHGKPIAKISPIKSKIKKSVMEHPIFGYDKSTRPVEEVMSELRGSRYNDI